MQKLDRVGVLFVVVLLTVILGASFWESDPASRREGNQEAAEDQDRGDRDDGRRNGRTPLVVDIDDRPPVDDDVVVPPGPNASEGNGGRVVIDPDPSPSITPRVGGEDPVQAPVRPREGETAEDFARLTELMAQWKDFPKKHEVASGDSPWLIARRTYGAKLGHYMNAEILKENGIGDAGRVQIGDELVLPRPSEDLVRRVLIGKRASTPKASETPKERPVAAVEKPRSRRRAASSSAGRLPFEPSTLGGSGAGDRTRRSSARASAGGRSYVVKAGDTLGAISLRFYRTTSMVDEIMEANGLSDPRGLREGQKLVLP